MRKKLRISSLALSGLLFAGQVQAQISTNPDKFLGNITTRYQVDAEGLQFYKLWNQITPENESKWGSVEGNRGSFNWSGADNCYNYAKSHKFPFKFHAIIWGAQHPNWFNSSMSVEERRKALINWMDNMKKHYKTIDMIDVANECIAGHQGDTYLFEEPLGGKGQTGWDYLVNAFEMAHERWPDAILIYNDFNTFRWQKSEFIDLVTALRDAGAPIDAYGCQSHDLTDMEIDEFKRAMDEIQSKLKMPMLSSEYDIGTDDDALQLKRYSTQIPYMWEADYCGGITLWGWVYGATWTTNGNSGIYRNRQERPAMTWLKEYMQTEKAKTAKSPFPGMKKEADLYIKPAAFKVPVGEPTEIDLRAKLRTKTIDRIEFYANNQLYETLTEAPWVVKYTPGKQGKISLRAVMVATDGTKYERLGALNVAEARKAYTSNNIPGVIQAENFDIGLEGNAFHDSDFNNTGDKTSYRTNGGGVDISSGNGGTVVSQTEDGEWLEYTVKVKTAGYYSYDLTATSGVVGSVVSLSMKTDEGYVPLTGDIEVPCVKKGAWKTYRTLYGRIPVYMEEGQHVLRLNIVKGGCYIDKIQFRSIEINEDIQVEVKPEGEVAAAKEEFKIQFDVKSNGAEIASVTYYMDAVKQKVLNEAPYEVSITPTVLGECRIMAYATDADGKVSPMDEKTFVVKPRRVPYKGIIEIPGIIEAENFDSMGEGYSFHDSDDVDEGAAKYRSDNEGVDILKANDGYVIGNIVSGEWLDYSINVVQPGEYSYTATVSNGDVQGKFQLYLVDELGKETSISARKSVTAYKDWNKYRQIGGSLTSKLTRGEHILRVKFSGPFNLDKIELTCTTPDEDAIETIVAQRVDTYEVYTVGGAKVGQFRAAAGESLKTKAYGIAGQHGAFVLKNTATGEAKTVVLGE